MFNVKIFLRNKKIFCELEVDSYFFEKHKYDYAFYLIRVGDKDKLDARWYEEKMKANFDIPEAGTFYIRCFIRDKNIMNIRTYDSEKISIE